MSALPPMPRGQETFYYASQTTFWIFMKADRALVEKHAGATLERLGLSLARFSDGDAAYVVITPMVYTATFNNGSAGIPEVELNVLVYPTSQKARVPELTFAEFLLGWDQQKVIGQLRLDVITDNQAAVEGGRSKYGEHKFLGVLTYLVPSPNDNARAPAPFSLEFTVSQQARTGQQPELAFKLEASIAGLSEMSTNASEVVVYGALPPEPAAGARQRTIATRRNHLGMYSLWMAGEDKHGHVRLHYGDCHDAPPLIIDGQPVPGSPEWPRQMRERMAHMLVGATPAAYLLFASPPVEIEPRPYYVDPV